MGVRRREGRCIRCGRSACSVAICPLLPARRPEGWVGKRDRRPVSAKKVTWACVEDEAPGQNPDSDSEGTEEPVDSGKE